MLKGNCLFFNKFVSQPQVKSYKQIATAYLPKNFNHSDWLKKLPIRMLKTWKRTSLLQDFATDYT